MNVSMLRAEAETKKARLKELASALETRSLTETEEKEVDTSKQHLTDLQTKIERAEYLQSVAQAKAPANNDERDFATRSRGFSVSKLAARAAGKSVDIGSEQEISDELKRNDSLAMGDFLVPFEALETRTILTEADNSGANKLKTENYMDFISYLRNRLVVGMAGATMLRGNNSTIRIPRQTNTTQARWLTEAGTATNDDLTFDSIELKPRKLMGLTSFSAQTELESNPSIEMLCRNDLMAVIAQEMDRVALYGGGDKDKTDGKSSGRTALPALKANEPKGITAVTNAIDGGVAGADLTYGTALGMINKLDDDNIMDTRRAFICNSSLKTKLMQTLQASGFTAPAYVWMGGGIAGMSTYVSNMVKSNNSTDADNDQTAANLTGSDLFYGQWSDLLISFFGSGVNLMLNPYGTGFTAGSVGLRSIVFADVAVRRIESFERYRKILTA